MYVNSRLSLTPGVAPTAVAGPSSVRSFHASLPAAETQAKKRARQKRLKVLEQRAKVAASVVAERADPILGAPHSSEGGASALYEGCKLQKVVLIPNDIWYAPVPNYAAGEGPKYYLPGMTETERQLLFEGVPHATAALSFEPERPAASAAAVEDQEMQTQAMKRILDLRNASKAGIEIVNRERIIAAFGRTPTDTASAEVQTALLTHKIRSLWNHIQDNRRDIQNRTRLRMLVHKRATVLKYAKRQNEERYYALLTDVGLTPSAVEGEIMVGM